MRGEKREVHEGSDHHNQQEHTCLLRLTVRGLSVRAVGQERSTTTFNEPINKTDTVFMIVSPKTHKISPFFFLQLRVLTFARPRGGARKDSRALFSRLLFYSRGRRNTCEGFSKTSSVKNTQTHKQEEKSAVK